MPVPFDERTIEYTVVDSIQADGLKNKDLTGRTNPQTWKLMKEGYVVLKNFIPKEIVNMTMDSWKRMELDPEMSQHLYLEDVIIDRNAPEDSLYKSNGMYNSPFGVSLHRWIWEKLKNHIDMDLQETYSYTRKYHRGAYLKAHADRPSCEISATLCLDYMTDDNTPWSIWVDNSQDFVNRPNEIYKETQAIPIRKRKTSKKIDLEVGDLLLYQGPNVAHWRERLLGEYSYHIFVHFYDINTSMKDMPGISDIRERVAEEIKQQDYKVKYNPCKWDGRQSRWHPKDDSWQGRLHEDLMVDIWNNDEIWLKYQKSDFVNRYAEFKQIKDGKIVEDNPNIFKQKYEDDEIVKVPRETPA
tara:strand:- start:368 stop:1435 length:1068 start_codon:yes stop_codon:yes gene_type:complete